MLTFEIVCGAKTYDIIQQWAFDSNTMSDWRQFINEVLLEYIENNSEKVGYVGKFVEVDESKFGKRKFNKGNLVEGQCVFGGVERDSGRVFLVAVHNRSQVTLKECILQLI